MSHSHEPSYYEIALTNRQVLVVFVVLLACVIASFFAGVWIGRGGDGSPDRFIAEAQAAETPSEYEQLKYFEREPEAQTEPKSAMPQATERSGGSSTLAEDVARAAAGSSETGGSKQSKPTPPVTKQAEPPAKRSEPEPQSPPAPAPELTPQIPSAESWVIQVFSSNDEAQAGEVARKLLASGYPAQVTMQEINGQSMFRVRVGPYGVRGEADSAAKEIKQSFRYDTWITQG